MKKVYSNILVLFSLFMIVFCMASCGPKTIFGTYINESNSNEYYTLKKDYTWESHENSGTFTYVDGQSTIDFIDADGKKFILEIFEYKYLRIEEIDEELQLMVTTYYTKK